MVFKLCHLDIQLRSGSSENHAGGRIPSTPPDMPIDHQIDFKK